MHLHLGQAGRETSITEIPEGRVKPWAAVDRAERADKEDATTTGETIADVAITDVTIKEL